MNIPTNVHTAGTVSHAVTFLDLKMKYTFKTFYSSLSFTTVSNENTKREVKSWDKF